MTPDRSLSAAVIQAIAEAEGVNEGKVRPPFYDAVNPEALDTLFHNTTGSITFSYHGYLVTVTSEGDVTIASLRSGEGDC